MTELGRTPTQMQAAVAASAFFTLCTPGTCSVTSVKKRPLYIMSKWEFAPLYSLFCAYTSASGLRPKVMTRLSIPASVAMVFASSWFATT